MQTRLCWISQRGKAPGTVVASTATQLHFYSRMADTPHFWFTETLLDSNGTKLAQLTCFHSSKPFLLERKGQAKRMIEIKHKSATYISPTNLLFDSFLFANPPVTYGHAALHAYA